MKKFIIFLIILVFQIACGNVKKASVDQNKQANFKVTTNPETYAQTIEIVGSKSSSSLVGKSSSALLPNFEIPDGTPITLEITVLAKELTNGAGGEPIDVRLYLDNGSGFKSLNNGNAVDSSTGTFEVNDLTAGTLVFQGTTPFREARSTGAYVITLQNGDSLSYIFNGRNPNVQPPFDNQQPIDEVISQYVDGDIITGLPENSILMLFEIGTYVPESIFYDFQDLVIVASIKSEESQGIGAPAGIPVDESELDICYVKISQEGSHDYLMADIGVTVEKCLEHKSNACSVFDDSYYGHFYYQLYHGNDPITERTGCTECYLVVVQDNIPSNGGIGLSGVMFGAKELCESAQDIWTCDVVQEVEPLGLSNAEFQILTLYDGEPLETTTCNNDPSRNQCTVIGFADDLKVAVKEVSSNTTREDCEAQARVAYPNDPENYISFLDRSIYGTFYLQKFYNGEPITDVRMWQECYSEVLIYDTPWWPSRFGRWYDQVDGLDVTSKQACMMADLLTCEDLRENEDGTIFEGNDFTISHRYDDEFMFIECPAN